MKIGDKLREAREKKRLTLKTICHDTRISAHIIRDLEDENFSNFQGKFYMMSFLKAYSNYLGVTVDTRNVLINEKQEQILPLDKRKTKIEPHRFKKKSAIAVGIIITAVLIIHIWVKFYPAGLNFTKSFESKKNKEYKVLISTINKIMIMGITAEPTWLRVVSDDKIEYEGILDEDTTKYWQADKNLKLRIGNVPGINIYYRNSPEKSYKEIDIKDGSFQGINEIEFVNESRSYQKD